MSFSDSESPTAPAHSGLMMTIPQVIAALSSFPDEQQALLRAMLRAADDNGFIRGVARLTRMGPFEAEAAKAETKTKAKKR